MLNLTWDLMKKSNMIWRFYDTNLGAIWLVYYFFNFPHFGTRSWSHYVSLFFTNIGTRFMYFLIPVLSFRSCSMVSLFVISGKISFKKRVKLNNNAILLKYQTQNCTHFITILTETTENTISTKIESTTHFPQNSKSILACMNWTLFSLSFCRIVIMFQ